MTLKITDVVTKPKAGPKVGYAEQIRLAAEARVSIPTVTKALAGELVRGDAGVRIRELLLREGLVEPTLREASQRRENDRLVGMIDAHRDRVRRLLEEHGDAVAEELIGRSAGALRRFSEGDPSIIILVLRQVSAKAAKVDAYLAAHDADAAP
jgi:transposase